MNGRAILAVLVIAAAAGGVALLSAAPATVVCPPAPVAAPAPDGGPGAPASSASATAAPADGAGFTSAKDCRSCHEDVWREWDSSMHGKAWTDPMVQALSNGFRMSECIDCHAPLPIHVTGVAQRVAPRKHDRSSGVDCISCHILDDGISVAAARTIDTSKTPGACRPVEVPAMRDASTCAGCHNQHETVLELEAANIGKTCADCHMEAAPRKNGPTGRSHVFPGAHSPEMHRRATKFEAEVKDGVVIARTHNVGAGHQIPTDARHRSYNVSISVWDEAGNALVTNAPMADGEYRLYYRQDFKPTTQIAHAKFREATWRIPDGVKGKAKVRLTYALNPEELGKGNVTEVATAEIQIR